MSDKHLVTVPGAVLLGLLMWSGVSVGLETGERADEAAVNAATVNEAAARHISAPDVEPDVEPDAIIGAVKEDGLSKAIVALAAALAVGLCAIATGIAQSRIGAAACGAIAERPESSGTVILLVAIPETMVILGFVVAVVLVFVL